MRAVLVASAAVAVAATAGCYDPSFREGLACSESNQCPDGQRCIAGTCTSNGVVDIDAALPPPDAPVADAPIAPPDADLGGVNVVFTTSGVTPGSFGGLTAADDLCQDEAVAAGLPGTYVAWLSDADVDAKDRLGSARGWVRPDGKPVVDTVADLIAGRMWFPPRLDAEGNDLGAGRFVWTNTTADGVFATAHNACQNWTSDKPGDEALVGRADSTFDGYTADSVAPCAAQASLLCFGIDNTAIVSPPPAETGRVAFVTETLFSVVGPAGTVSMLDDLCNLEAADNSLPGTYLAAVAVEGASAASRFDATAGTLPWRRVDGIRLSDEAAQMFDGSLLHTSPNLTPVGDPTSAPVWFGALSATSVGTNSCQSWSMTAGSGARGNPRSSDSKQVFGSGDVDACANANHLLCLQQ